MKKFSVKACVALAGGLVAASTGLAMVEANPSISETPNVKKDMSTVDRPLPNLGRGTNDLCGGAINIDCGSSATADLNLASAGIDEAFGACILGTEHTNTLWYSFTATDVGAVIETCASTIGADSTLGVYSGDCGSLVLIGCGEDECGGSGFLSSAEVSGLTIGETYYIQIGAWNAAGVSTYDLSVECFDPDAPGACCMPDGSCSEVGESTCNSMGGLFTGADVLCADADCFQPPVGAMYEGGGFFEPLFDGYNDSLNAGCNGVPAGSGPLVIDIVAGGQTWVGTSGTHTNAEGGAVRDTDWYQIDVFEDSVISVDFTPTFPGVIGFAELGPGFSCPVPSGVLDPFAAVAAGETGSFSTLVPAGSYIVFASTQDFDGVPVNSPYSFDVTVTGASDPVACCFTDGSCQDLGPSDCSAAGGATNTAPCADVTCPSFAVNSDFEGALPAECDSTFVVDLTQAVPNSDNAFSCGIGTAHTNDLWYSFVAGNANVSITSCAVGNGAGAATDTTFDAYSFDGTNLIELGCAEDTCNAADGGDFLTTLDLVGLTVGETYYFRVAAWNPAAVASYNVLVEGCTSDGGCDPACADVTGDGNVDLADLNLVLANFGQATDNGDGNCDGTVDLADLNLVLAQFGGAGC